MTYARGRVSTKPETMNRVRPLVQSDILQVAQLFLKVYPNGAGHHFTLGEVTRNLSDVFLNHPWRHECLTSLVCEASERKVIGFLGVTPRRMRFKGRPILVAVGAHLMVDPDARTSLAGLHLQREFLAGPQDLSFNDCTTDEGLAVWTSLGGAMATTSSVSWLRALRPAALAASIFLSKYRLLAPLRQVAKACSPLMDASLARHWPHRFRLGASRMVATALDTDTVLNGIFRLLASEPVCPEYDATTMKWLLARAHRISAPGTLQKAAFQNGAKEILGWYLYYLKPGGVSEVLQIIAKKNTIGDVFDHLCYDAWSRGAVALSGRVESALVETLGLNKCVLTCGNPWVVAHARDRALLHAVCQGGASLTRLDGEWCTSVRN
jgi:hypothetical protein